MARRIVILTKTSMEDGIGGVPVHCKLLRRVFPEAIHLTCSKIGVKSASIQEMSYNLGKLAEQKGLIQSSDLVITDGFWGHGLSNQNRVISVCHGTLAGDVGVQHPIAQFQKQHMQKNHCVAVGKNSAIECEKFYGFKCDTIILNGVDTEIFHPTDIPPKEFTVGFLAPQGKIQTARYVSLLNKIKSVFKTHIIEGSWPYGVAEEYQKCSMYLHLSRYEGCSYAVNEALASGLPIVGTSVGLFGKYQDFLGTYGILVGEILFPPIPIYEEIEKKILKICNNYSQYKPREWCLKYCNYNQFAEEWKNYIKIFENK